MNELVRIENGNVVVAQEIIKKIIDFKKYQAEMEYQEKLLKEGLMKAMEEVGITKFQINGLTATIKNSYSRTTVDSKRLKEEVPDIYEAYSKTVEVNPSIVLTVSE